MTTQFGRVLHLDCDLVVFDNVANLLENGEVPSIARRQGGCAKTPKFCTSQPVSNVMLISPNNTIWNNLTEFLGGLKGFLKRAPDETVQFSYHDHLNLMSPQDAIYSDCFWNQPDDKLKEFGLDVNNFPRMVHLGKSGK